MISRPQVNLGEHCCSSQLIQQVINSWQWVFVLDSQLVQLTVINTNLELPSFFFTNSTSAP